MQFQLRRSDTVMNMTTQNKPIELHHTGVPVDFRDPNHPHFPGDLEAQPSKHPFMNKKARLTTTFVVLAIASIITAVLVGGKLGMRIVKKPSPVLVTSTASVQVATAYMTTIVVSTDVVTYSATPDPTTITTTTTLPLPTPTLTPTLEPPKMGFEPPKDKPPEDTKGKCFVVGNWGTNAECNKSCVDTPDQSAHCEVDSNAGHKCVVCRNT
jgi:hypothetical protein